MRRLDRLAAVAVGLATALVIGFVALPILAIFLRVPASTLLAELHSKAALDALRVSLKTSLIALALILAFGTPVAYLLGIRRFRGVASSSTNEGCGDSRPHITSPDRQRRSSSSGV